MKQQWSKSRCVTSVCNAMFSVPNKKAILNILISLNGYFKVIPPLSNSKFCRIWDPHSFFKNISDSTAFHILSKLFALLDFKVPPSLAEELPNG